jgi:hypothetical protein
LLANYCRLAEIFPRNRGFGIGNGLRLIWIQRLRFWDGEEGLENERVENWLKNYFSAGILVWKKPLTPTLSRKGRGS